MKVFFCWCLYFCQKKVFTFWIPHLPLRNCLQTKVFWLIKSLLHSLWLLLYFDQWNLSTIHVNDSFVYLSADWCVDSFRKNDIVAHGQYSEWILSIYSVHTRFLAAKIYGGVYTRRTKIKKNLCVGALTLF